MATGSSLAAAAGGRREGGGNGGARAGLTGLNRRALARGLLARDTSAQLRASASYEQNKRASTPARGEQRSLVEASRM